MFLLLVLSLILVSPLASPPVPSDRPILLVDEAPSDGRLADAVAKLQELGVVTDPEYWLTNARKGKTCDGGIVADLMIRAAGKFQPTDNIESAIHVLQANNVLQNNKGGVEYWKTKTVSGTKCPGKFVGTILVNLADML
jgi:hypothetical protein